ncbi:hypothetical protein CEXT_107291 [Caerostris extrusa]|uniref:Uncharacterized protein n=1 Tax=Caerostris extrusa TaxID=172846 RepID=A0AAV4TC62_CAEEX|nr:hypothetical protein CEXT_107291 [Caerostris extrusa]
MGRVRILSTANTGKSFTRSASWIFAPITRDNGMRRGTTKENLFHNYEVNYIEKPSEQLAHFVNERSNYEETCL